MVVAAVLLLAAYVGLRLALQPAGDDVAVDATAERERQSANQQPEPSPTGDEAGDEAGDDTGDDAEQDPGGAEESGGDEGGPAPEVIALGDLPSVSVPGSAPANNDVTGEQVTFVGENMLDGDPATCWRVAGEPAGRVITFTFPEEVTITQLALVNGYAKTSTDASGREFDWYQGNRRLTQVVWVVGGQEFPASLGDTRSLQILDIEPTATTTVELRLDAATPPGPPPIGRDYTAISDVAFSGYVTP